MNELEQVTREVLVANMSPAFKSAIDRLRARGVDRDGILAFVRVTAANAARVTAATRRTATMESVGGLVVAQVEAYLDSLDTPPEGPAR